MTLPPNGDAAKAALRSEALARRDKILAPAREVASAAIAERAIAIAKAWDTTARDRDIFLAWGAARLRVLAAYMPIRNEVDLGPIIAWAFENGIAVVLPAVVDATTLVFRRYRTGDVLKAGRFGTLAPSADAEIADPDLVILPMVAFDRAGTRLGYGSGFYDRAIARLHAIGQKPLLVGAAFAAQEVGTILSEPHDVRMDWIVTENETLDFRSLK